MAKAAGFLRAGRPELPPPAHQVAAISALQADATGADLPAAAAGIIGDNVEPLRLGRLTQKLLLPHGSRLPRLVD